jgi:RNA polymerase sigma-70 factor, ECF subfamily
MTTTQALEDLRSLNDGPAWKEFDGHFRKVVISFARHSGLGPEEAEDAAQETMLAFTKAFRAGHYDKEKGRLRDWLFGVARNVVLNLRSKRPLEKLIADKATGTSFWDMVKDNSDIEQLWQSEWQNMVLARCLSIVKGETEPNSFKAFELYALQERPVDEVALELGLSKNAVYIAKSRILTRLRELEGRLE